VVIVDTLGRPDREYTRLGASNPGLFKDSLLAVVRTWRYSPAIANGRKVIAGIPLEIVVDRWPDSIPVHFTWRYVRGEKGDSVHGTWEPLPPFPPFSVPEQRTILETVLAALPHATYLGVRSSAPEPSPTCLVPDPRTMALRALNDLPTCTLPGRDPPPGAIRLAPIWRIATMQARMIVDLSTGGGHGRIFRCDATNGARLAVWSASCVEFGER
jgi:hypothetical protein